MATNHVKRDRRPRYAGRASIVGLVLAALAGLLASTANAGAAPASAPTSAAPAPGGGHAQGGAVAAPSAGKRPASVPETTPAGYSVSGIDIASYQHPNGAAINWAAVKASGRQFAYIKATEGTTYTNPYYASDLRGSIASGMYAGAYAFARLDANNPEAQADFLLSTTGYSAYAGGNTLVPFVDLETGDAVGVATCYGLSQAGVVSWIQRFLAEFQSHAGRLPAIYTSNGFWSTCTGNTRSFASAPLDVARWASTPTPLPGAWTNYTFWQYGSADSVPGIVGAVDGDVFRGSLADLKSFAAPAIAPQNGTLIADVNGDGKADLVVVTGGSVLVSLSTGTSFQPPVIWSNAIFRASVVTLAADINGDGKADIIGVNTQGTWVMLSTGSSFGPPQSWSSAVFHGAVITTAADVNGDGKADMVGVNATGSWVMLSNGHGFGPPIAWSYVVFHGTVLTATGDVNGDGKADMVGVNATGSWVMLSNGQSFGPPTPWSYVVFHGTQMNAVADMNGDGKADLVGVNTDGSWIMASTGSSYGPPTQWANFPFYGTPITLAGDVTGDSAADLTGIRSPTVFVLPSLKTRFATPQVWSS